MKKIIMLSSVLAAGMLMGASSTTAVAPPGADNIAAGYGAGYKSGGVNQDVVAIGTDAGMNSTNNTRCVFIGKNAGKGVKNKTDYIDIGGVFKADGTDIDIGGVFVRTNGVTTIEGLTANSIGALSCVYKDNIMAVINKYITYDEMYGIWWKQFGEVYSKLEVQNDSTTGYMGKLKFFDGMFWEYVVTDESPKTMGKLKFENGSLCVYTNGVKAGTLSFTPAQ